MLIQRMSQVLTTTQRVDQRMVMANTILQMSSLELQAKVEQELLENPALELVQLASCPRCQGTLLDGVCPSCARTAPANPGSGLPLAWWDVKYGSYLPDGLYHEDDDRDEDPMARLQAEVSLAEYLRGQLRAIIPSEDVPIGEYLIGNINDEGYLDCDIGEAAERFRVPASRVEAALAALQSLDPPGVGARDLRECLLIQLRSLAEEGKEVSLPFAIVDKCWRELVQHSYDRISRRLKVSETGVKQAVEFIRKDLNPYPGRCFTMPGGSRCDQASVVVRPDVIIRRGAQDFEIEIVESDRFLLKISDDYRKMLRDYSGRRGVESEEVRSHVSQYLSRAQLLIRSISQRRKTLMAITRCIVECQRAFLESGSVSTLRSLTRAEVADKVGMHESTISRATAGKFAQLPAGETIPFDDFFHGSLRIKDRIRQYISQEDPAAPLTDQEIANRLWEQEGIRIARRTVLKYREQMRILSSSQRRGLGAA